MGKFPRGFSNARLVPVDYRIVIDACKTNVRVSLFRANFNKRFISGHDFTGCGKTCS
jgi:hypothetical protein